MKSNIKSLGAAPQEPAMRITTATGSYYVIDNGLWSKNGGEWAALMWAYSIAESQYSSWKEINAAEHLPIQIGQHLCIGGFNGWWVSTPIVSIEERPATVPADQITAHPTRPLRA